MNRDTLLTILQQTEYQLDQFRAWVQTHDVDDENQLQPEKWTTKLQLISLVSQFFIFLPLPRQITLAVWVLSPIDWYLKHRIIRRAKARLSELQHKGLKVVAIAGSYAKTSTKHMIFHTLTPEKRVIMTPKSVNTILGMAQFVLDQLTDQHQLAIMEFGEFNPGDIQRMLEFTCPKMGILTPIGRQHLERFAGIDGLATEFGEFTKYFHAQKYPYISAEQNTALLGTLECSYGKSDADWTVCDLQISIAGTEYHVEHQQKKLLKVFTPLLGEHQAVNTLCAFWLALQLEIPPDKVAKRLATMPFIPHRHEPQFLANNVVILDNGYNSNPDSVRESLKLLEQLPADRKIVVTMGFVELGSLSKTLHHEFGRQLAQVADELAIINTPNAQDIKSGFLSSHPDRVNQVLIGSSQAECLRLIQPSIIPSTIILLENGFQELYG